MIKEPYILRIKKIPTATLYQDLVRFRLANDLWEYHQPENSENLAKTLVSAVQKELRNRTKENTGTRLTNDEIRAI